MKDSLEALENIAITFDEGGYEPTTLGAKSGSFKEVFGVEFNIIEQDLKRLRQKQLEEKNKELNEKIKELKSIIEEQSLKIANDSKEMSDMDLQIRQLKGEFMPLDCLK